MVESQLKEETLDPDDWEEMRKFGHKLVDDIINEYVTIREGKTVTLMNETALKKLDEPLPLEPQGFWKTYQDYIDFRNIVPGIGIPHPLFLGWVNGCGTIMGAFADLLISSINTMPTGSMVFPYHLEAQVIKWIKEALRYSSTATGVLVSGGSMANLTGLTIARNMMVDYDFRKQGYRSEEKLKFYGSSEMHASLQKALEVLGLGSDSLRAIPVDEEFKIRVDLLKQAIKEDREQGYKPVCIVGACGTTNTGSIDDLNTLADICDEEGLWFHVDAAFGAWAILSDELAPLVSGMERADSLALDLHKWMYVPYAVGCILIKDPYAQVKSFSMHPDYLTKEDADPPWTSDLGIELSTRWRALKVWMQFKETGLLKHGRLIQQNHEQAKYLAEKVKMHPNLELLATPVLQIACFRYYDPELDEEALNNLNMEIMNRLWMDGTSMPSSTVLNGKYTIRCAVTNHRTKYSDLDWLLEEVVKIGNQLNR